MRGILDGVRVVELGDGIGASFCGKLLADYGADVIKCEQPRGHETRRTGPFVGDDPHQERSIPFLYLNTNKRGVTLSVEDATGRRLLGQLAETADVVVEDFPAGWLEGLGAGYGRLAEVNPALVMTSITPFGQRGPYRDLAATDAVVFALSGLMYHSGDSDKEPLRNALNQSFYVAGVNAAVATMAGLFQRLATGRGQHVDVSAAECLTSHLVQAVPYYSFTGAIKGRRPMRGSGFEELMPARDGYVIPSVQGSQPWATVADLVGVEGLQDGRFATGAGRIENGEELNQLLLQGLAEWDRKELFQASGERRLVFGMAQDGGDLMECPHLEARDFFDRVDHPVAGAAEYPGIGPKLSGLEKKGRKPAPLLGEHNREVFQGELGCSAAELVQLRCWGAI